MRCIAKAAALALVVLAFLASNLVLAEDYITDAAQALQHAPVYVAPNAEGTDNNTAYNTASTLQARLNSSDNIILVILPATAEAELGVDIYTIASRLSEKMGNQRIIGLAVGKKVIGYAPALPDVADDQMRRAQSVSNDQLTALTTFVQNMHNWQTAQPKPSPTPTPKPTKETQPKEDVSWLLWVVVLGILISAIAIIGTASKESRRSMDAPHVPNQLRNLLAQIAREREGIGDPDLRTALRQLIHDIERYFESSSKDKKGDALFFRDRLTEAAQIMAKYIDVQENPRYYNKPKALLEQGKEALIDFCQYVLASIKRGNDADLEEFKVNAGILQAHRLMADPEEGFDRALNPKK